MKLAEQLRFFRWFARRDLYEPNALRITRVNRRSVALITALTLLAFGAAEGTRALRLQRFRANPTSTCLWIGDPNYEGEFTPEKVARIGEALGPQLGTGLRALRSFDPVREAWLQRPDDSAGPASSLGAGLHFELTGRTVEPSEPLLDSLKGYFIHGEPFSSPDQFGVIVTEEMFDLLRTGQPPASMRTPSAGKAAVSYPTSLSIFSLRDKSGRMEVPLIGVIRATLPLQQQFLLTAEGARSLHRQSAPVRYKRIMTGPVPSDGDKAWPRPNSSDLPRKAKEAAWLLGKAAPETSEDPGDSRPKSDLPTRDTQYLIDRFVARDDGGRKVWLLETGHTSGLRPDDWTELLQRIAGEMKRAGFDAPADFVDGMKIEPQDRIEETKEVRPPRMAAVYLTEPRSLILAAEILESEFHIKCDREQIGSLLEIDRNTQQAMLATSVLAMVLLFNGCSNMRVIQRLRAELKLTEIGMLKAMGMSAGQLRGLHLYEAWLVWRDGTAWGVILGLILGYTANQALPLLTNGQFALGFRCPWTFLVLVPAATGLFFLYSAVAGTREARMASPIETLRTS